LLTDAVAAELELVGAPACHPRPSGLIKTCQKSSPPDVIDHVGGIEIAFVAEDPSVLAGKTIDVRDRKFFIRD
jgi:hypothetical protein